MDKMTVKELMELLKNYDENKTVEIMGGEDGNGSWAELSVGNDAIMEYGYWQRWPAEKPAKFFLKPLDTLTYSCYNKDGGGGPLVSYN